MKKVLYFFSTFILLSCSSNVADKLDDVFTKISVFTTSDQMNVSDDIDAFNDVELNEKNISSRSFAIYRANLSYSYGLTHGDTIGIFPENDYQIPFALPIPVGPPVTSSSMLAEGWSTKQTVLYAVYLPWKFENRYYDHIPWDNRVIQKQKGNDNTDSISNYWLLASDTLHSGDASFGARLINMQSMIRCQVKAPVAGTFTRMILAAASPVIPTHGYYNLFDVTAPKEDTETSPGVFAQITSCPYLHQPFFPEGYTDHIVLDLENVSAAYNANVRGWYLFPECDLSGIPLSVYLFDSAGNCYSATKTYADLKITRSSIKGIGFSGLTLVTTPLPKLNPWEDEDLCPTCNPVAF